MSCSAELEKDCVSIERFEEYSTKEVEADQMLMQTQKKVQVHTRMQTKTQNQLPMQDFQEGWL